MNSWASSLKRVKRFKRQAFETLIHEMLQILFSLLCVKYIFRFYRSVGFEGNIKYAKKGITSAMESADLVAFNFVV